MVQDSFGPRSKYMADLKGLATNIGAVVALGG